MTIIRANFDSKKDFDPELFDLQVKTWQRQFANESAKNVFNAWEKWLAENPSHFAPQPAHLKQIIAKAKNPESFISGEKAWEQVNWALRRFGNPNELQAKNALKPNIWRAIQSVGGWQNLCATPDTEMGFKRRNFISAFDEFDGDTKEQFLLDENILKRLKRMDQEKRRLAEPNDEQSM